MQRTSKCHIKAPKCHTKAPFRNPGSRRDTHRVVALLLLAALLFAFRADAQNAAPPTRNLEDVSRKSVQPVPVGPYVALIIGNSQYRTLKHLATPELDATAIGQILREGYGFKTTIRLNATRADIITAIADLRGLPEEANVLIYYAGHGDQDEGTGVAYWLPVDAEATNKSNWISASDLTDQVRGMKARHVLLISDSCYSGAIKNVIMLRGGHSSIDPENTQNAIAASLQRPSRTLLASGQDQPVLDGGGDGHSIFAKAVLDGLESMPYDRFLANELYAVKVKRSVDADPNNETRQDPVYAPLSMSGDKGGDFVFTRLSKAELAANNFAAALARYQAKDYIAALAAYKHLAELGDPRGFYAVGQMIERGEGTQKSPEEALSWYLKGAESGSVDSMTALSWAYMLGSRGVSKDPAMAKQWLDKAVEVGGGGYGLALFSMFYEIGFFVPKDEVEAEKLLRAAASDSPAAMLRLSEHYSEGRLVAKDPVQAAVWARKAAEGGEADAMNRLGTFYQRGLGVAPSLTSAADWYRKAAEHNDRAGMYNLAILTLEGKGVRKDPKVGQQAMEKAAIARFAPAQDKVAQLYLAGDGVPRSEQKAAEWLYAEGDLFVRFAGAEDFDIQSISTQNIVDLPRSYVADNLLNAANAYKQAYVLYAKLAEGGDARDMANLGTMLYCGFGTARDVAAARDWWIKAAAAGNPIAMNNLGWLYERGEAVPQSFTEAARLYERAIENNPGALGSLGELYARGQGVPRNGAKALELCSKGVKLNDPGSMTCMGFLSATGSGVTKNYDDAVRWYEQAANLSETLAMERLGDLCQRGEGVPRDLNAAMRWYNRAALHGSADGETKVLALAKDMPSQPNNPKP